MSRLSLNGLDKGQIRNILKMLEVIKYDRYAYVLDNVAYDLDDNVIPPEHIQVWQNERGINDGWYRLGEHVCSGRPKTNCAVGEPNPECIGKCFSSRKCARYEFEPINRYSWFTTADILEVMSGTVQPRIRDSGIRDPIIVEPEMKVMLVNHPGEFQTITAVTELDDIIATDSNGESHRYTPRQSVRDLMYIKPKGDNE